MGDWMEQELRRREAAKHEPLVPRWSRLRILAPVPRVDEEEFERLLLQIPPECCGDTSEVRSARSHHDSPRERVQPPPGSLSARIRALPSQLPVLPSNRASTIEQASSSVVTQPKHPKPKRAPGRPSRRDLVRKGAALLTAHPSRGHSQRTGQVVGRFEARDLEEQLLPASDVVMCGLERWPEDDFLRDSFDEILHSYTMYDAARRYNAWPFQPSKEKVIEKGEPPGKLAPPYANANDISWNAVTIRFSSALAAGMEQAGSKQQEDTVAIEAVAPLNGVDNSPPMSVESGKVMGYELQLVEVNALWGRQLWKSVHRGKVDKGESKTLRNFGRGVSGLYARVRGYNKFGRGEWSDESHFMELCDVPEEEQIELTEIPAAWVEVDLGGIDELKDDLDPKDLRRAKEDLLRSMHANRNAIKVAFRYYALFGAADIDVDPDTMTMLQFTAFAQNTKITETPAFSNLSNLDLVFVRAARAQLNNKASEPVLADLLESSGIKISKRKGKGKGWLKAKAGLTGNLGIGKASLADAASSLKGSGMLTQTQFLGGLLRLAASMYGEDRSLGQKLTTLCKVHVCGHVFDELELVKDDFNQQMRSRKIGAALDTHSVMLRQVFTSYAAADTGSGSASIASRAAARAAQATMNVREVDEMCADCDLFDETFTTMQLLAIFVKVNIDDELFQQEEKANSSSELVFDEFEEVVARIFNVAVYQPLMRCGKPIHCLFDDDDDDELDRLYNTCNQGMSNSVSTDEIAHGLKTRFNAGAAQLIAYRLVEIADSAGLVLANRSLTREAFRATIAKFSSPDVGDTTEITMERAFHEWLGSVFLPKTLAAVKKKKLRTVVSKLR